MPISPTHPRLWQNGRPAYLIAQKTANSTYWQQFQADKGIWGAGNSIRLRQFVWQWVADPIQDNLDDMLACLDDEYLAYGATAAQFQDRFLNDYGVEIGDWVEDIAFCYDWAYDELDATQKAKCEDIMLLMIQCVYNAHDPWISAINNVADDSSMEWANDVPGNNYFATKMKAVVYAYLAMYGAIPTTTNIPAGDPTDRFTWSLEMPDGSRSQDMGAFLDYWLGERAVADLDYLFDGGGWHEGHAYGTSPPRNYFDMFRVMSDAGGSDYTAGKDWWADRIMYVIHTALEGNIQFERGEKISGHSGSNRISVLYACDYLRVNDPTNPALFWGQYWLNTNYSNTRSEASASWNFGHDFFLWNGTVTGVDYRNTIDPFWYARGCGQYISHRDFSSTDDVIGIASYWITQDHADHDQTDFQIFRAGHGGAQDCYGYLVCDVKAGGDGKHWVTRHHNCHTIGGGAKAEDGVTPPAIGFEQRFGDQGPKSVASIVKHCGNRRFSYVQAEANDAYRYIPGQRSVNCHWNDPPMTDVCMREFVHLRAQGVLVIYDRVRIINTAADPTQPGKDISHFHYPLVEPTDVGGGIRRVTCGENRLFRKHIFPVSGMVTEWAADPVISPSASSIHAWRERNTIPQTYTPNPNRQYSRNLVVFQFGDKDVLTSMATTVALSGTNLEGVTIKLASGWHHVIFSAMQDGATPQQVSYLAEKNANGDRHIICNLTPGHTYKIKETLVIGAMYQYDLGGTGTVSAVANSAGVVEFTLGQLIPRRGDGGGGFIPTDPGA